MDKLRIGLVCVPVPPVDWLRTVPDPVAPPKIPVPRTTCHVPSSVPRLGQSRPSVVTTNCPALVPMVTALRSRKPVVPSGHVPVLEKSTNPAKLSVAEPPGGVEVPLPELSEPAKQKEPGGTPGGQFC